jgi:hypothetical protein
MHAADGAVGREDELAMHGHPNVRVCASAATSDQQIGERNCYGKKLAKDHGLPANPPEVIPRP